MYSFINLGNFIFDFIDDLFFVNIHEINHFSFEIRNSFFFMVVIFSDSKCCNDVLKLIFVYKSLFVEVPVVNHKAEMIPYSNL